MWQLQCNAAKRENNVAQCNTTRDIGSLHLLLLANNLLKCLNQLGKLKLYKVGVNIISNSSQKPQFVVSFYQRLRSLSETSNSWNQIYSISPSTEISDNTEFVTYNKIWLTRIYTLLCSILWKRIGSGYHEAKVNRVKKVLIRVFESRCQKPYQG